VIFHRYALVIVGNALTLTHHASQDFSHYAYQSVAANGDTFSHQFYLASGVYTLNLHGLKVSDSGKIDWYIDNLQVVSGQDWYGAGTTYNHIKTAAVTVKGHGRHVLKGVVNGLTAPSTGYAIKLTAISFV
jgi:hypothetical protein